MKIKSGILNSRILIIEDDFVGRATLVQIFKKNGFVNIESAEDGKKGLEKIYAYKPNLVITDIQMPEMDGFELCRQVRSHENPDIANTPILVETALTESEDKTHIFEAGASDYVRKPIDAKELMARSVIHLERELMMRELRDFNQRVVQELDIAKSTQLVLMPYKEEIAEAESRYKLRIREHFQTCSELGGDFWGILPISASKFAVYTVDFSGHGVNAALNVFRLHAMMQTLADIAHAPAEYLTKLNAILAPILPRGTFATMFYGVIDVESNSLAYSAAASPAPVIFKRGGAQEILDSSGMLLGAVADYTYKTTEVDFSAGDCLFLYSDALTETMDKNDAMLELEEVVKIFSSELNKNTNNCDAAFDKLLGAFNDNYAARLNDDLTMAAFYRG